MIKLLTNSCMVMAMVVALASSASLAQAPPATQPAVVRRPKLPSPGFMPHCLNLIKKERYEEARRLLEPVVSEHPGWGRAKLYLGLTYHKEFKYAPARKLFEQAIKLDPEYEQTLVFYGWSLYYLGELQASREQFEKYLKLNPEYADAIFALGLIEFDTDEIESAKQRFLLAIEISQSHSDASTESKARARLADVHIRNGALAEAKKELDRSIELKPDNYETYFKLSRVLQRLGDAEGAAAARQKHKEVRERIRPTQGRMERRPGE